MDYGEQAKKRGKRSGQNTGSGESGDGELDWSHLWSVGVYDFRLPLDFFESLTFAEFCDLAERHSLAQEREQYFFGQICTHIRWAMGDKDAAIADFLPRREAEPSAAAADSTAGNSANERAAMEQRFIAAMTSIGIKPEPA